MHNLCYIKPVEKISQNRYLFTLCGSPHIEKLLTEHLYRKFQVAYVLQSISVYN